MKKILICIFLILAGCSSRQAMLSAVAEDNQSIVFNSGYEGIFSDAPIKAVCFQSNILQAKSPRQEFAILLTNTTDQPITVDLENLKAFDADQKPLKIITAGQLKKEAKKALMWSSVANAIGGISNVGYGSSVNISNNNLLRNMQMQEDRKEYDESKLKVQRNYLQKQTILSHHSYEGYFLVQTQSKNKTISIVLDLPEINVKKQFTFIDKKAR